MTCPPPAPSQDLTRVVPEPLVLPLRAEAGGHGTHVAGSIAGAQSGEDVGDDDADGMAFQGQLAVFDFGESDNSNALTTPEQVCAFHETRRVRTDPPSASGRIGWLCLRTGSRGQPPSVLVSVAIALALGTYFVSWYKHW